MAANNNLKVLFACAEVAPFSSVGGLSQVAYFLPRALKKLGADVRLFTPKYGNIDDKKYNMHPVCKLKIDTGETDPNTTQPKILEVEISKYQKTKDDVIIYFVHNDEYYQKRANVYGYSDDHIRFGLLSKAAMEFIKQCGEFVPDVLHANDWHTGYILDYINHDPQYKNSPQIRKIASLLSVHNIYQGMFDFAHASEMDFDDGKSPLSAFFSDRFYKQNALRRGVMYADVVNTVSESYVTELMTEEYGGGLHNLFKELRGKFYGVLNGLDITDFNPSTDKIIKKNFSKNDIRSRMENKLDLQKQFGLDQNPDTPILSYVGRLDNQKGIDLIMSQLEFILDELDVQFVIVGQGDQHQTDFFNNLVKRYPGRIGAHLMRDFLLPRKVFAGADMMLMPSKYEPGGIVAIEALRYGCVPIVRATGGLADSVINYDPQKNKGYGFSFKQFRSESFLAAVVRATEVYRNKNEWNKILRRALEADFSWAKSAEKYLDLYRRAIDFHKEAQEPNPSPAFRPLYS